MSGHSKNKSGSSPRPGKFRNVSLLASVALNSYGSVLGAPDVVPAGKGKRKGWLPGGRKLTIEAKVVKPFDGGTTYGTIGMTPYHGAVSSKENVSSSAGDIRALDVVRPAVQPGVAEQVRTVGVASGRRLSPAEADLATRKIVGSATDVFGTESAALDFLKSRNFDGTGVRGVDLIRNGRVGRVLSCIDDRRYGFQG